MTTAELTSNKTYEQYKKLISTVAGSFYRRANVRRDVSYDDIMAEANWIYMKAVRSYNPNQGSLKKRIAYKIWWGLKGFQKRTFHYESFFDRSSYHDLDNSVIELWFDYKQFLDELSEDAAFVAKTAVSLFSFKKRMGKKRKMLLKYLANLGWSDKRIQKSFDELKEVIKNG